MTIKVKYSHDLLRRLHASSDAVLDDLETVTRSHASEALAAAQVTVPRDTGGLAQSAFADGPERNSEDSVSATAGYAHPAAGAIHEGVHWGLRPKVAGPHWLRNAARKFRSRFRKAVAAQIPQTLARVFRA